ncbi:unnamed protein product [Ectocarpus sp. 13 AM-2016]
MEPLLLRHSKEKDELCIGDRLANKWEQLTRSFELELGICKPRRERPTITRHSSYSTVVVFSWASCLALFAVVPARGSTIFGRVRKTMEATGIVTTVRPHWSWVHRSIDAAAHDVFFSIRRPVCLAQTYGANTCCAALFHPCDTLICCVRRCVGSGGQCAYIVRRWHLPKPHQQQHQPQRPDRDGAHGREVLKQSVQPGALVACGMMPLKRFRLSASPATGLVGMQENAFLSDFFACVGFVPLTSHSRIRETMVKIMASPAPLQQSAVGGACGEVGSKVRAPCWSKASERNQPPMDPSNCTFWCAIALGALAKGNPVESVAKYCNLAHEGLTKSDPSSSDAEVATAWAMLAYMYGFMGDLARFQEYLALSESFVKSATAKGFMDTLPLGFAEVVLPGRIPNASCGQWETKSLHAEEHVPPQLADVAAEGELYKYVAHSFKAFEQAFQQKAYMESATDVETPGEAEGHGESDRNRRAASAFLPGEISEAMGTVFGDRNLLVFEPLEEAVDRPSIRGGIGSLLINGTLVFEKAAKGDRQATLERIGRCVEVFELYPGMCRCTIGHHKAHMMLVCLAAIGDSSARAMYDRLRGSYNSFRPSVSRPVPPLEEWQGLGAFCDDFYCRAMEGLVASDLMKAFSAPSVGGFDVCVETKGTESDQLSTCDNPEKIIGTILVRPSEDAGGSGPTLASTTIPVARPASSHHAWCHLKTEFHSGRIEKSVAHMTMADESLPRLPQLSEGGGLLEDNEDRSIFAEDWLDVTHAMLDTVSTV